MDIKKFRVSWYIIFVLALILSVIPVFQPTSVLAYTTTIYSSASDGDFPKAGEVGGAYATIWEATTCTPDASTYAIVGQRYASAIYVIYRTFLLFDTSSIPSGAVITAATLNLYGRGTGYSLGQYAVVIQNGQPTYPHDPVIASDYNKENYAGDGGSFSTSTWNISGYNTITLNADGRGWINKGGTTKLFIRSSKDIAGTVPTTVEYVTIYASEELGTSKDPYLSITYIVVPEATTMPATLVTNSSARIWGNITNDGGASCEARFHYSKILKRDNFEWGNDGDDITTSGGGLTWVKVVAGTSTAKIDTGQYHSGTRSVELYRDGTNTVSIRFTHTAGIGYQIGFWMRRDSTSQLMWTHADGVKEIICRHNSGTGKLQYYNGAWIDTAVSIPVGEWGLIEIKNIDWTAGTYDLYLNGAVAASSISMPAYESWVGTNLIRWWNIAGISSAWIDDVEVVEDWAVTDWQNTLVTNSTYYKDLTGLTAGTEYEYQTQAKNTAGEGAWSASAYFTTLLVAIVNIPTTIGFGILEVNSTANTAINYFTLNNTGNCAVVITIQGTDMAGGGFTWTLSDNATPGNMIYGLKAGLDDADDTFDVIVKKNSPYNTLVSNLAVNATQGWGLKIWTPTSYNDGNLKTGTVTLTASMVS